MKISNHFIIMKNLYDTGRYVRFNVEKSRQVNFKKIMRTLLCIGGLAMAILSVFFFQYMIGYGNDIDSDNNTVSINEGWTVVEHGEIHEDVDIISYRLKSSADTGDVIVLQRVLPQDFVFTHPVLKFQSHKSAIKVWVDDKLISSYGQDRYENNLILGSGYQLVNLSADMQGKVVRIELKVASNSAFKRFDSITITDSQHLYYDMLDKYRLPFLIGVFLVILGIVLMAGGNILAFKNFEFIRSACVGLLSMCVGCWSICYYRLSQLFYIPIYMSSLIEHISLYVGAIPFMLYFLGHIRELKNVMLYKAYKAVLALQCCFTAMVLLGAGINQRIITDCLAYEHMIMIAVIVMLVIMTVKSYRNKEYTGSNKVLMVGFMAFILLMVSDMVAYILRRTFGVILPEIAGAACIGGLVFIAVLLMSLGMSISRRLQKLTEQEVLYRMAYTDDLTQIYNRRFCEGCMEKISHAKSPFTIYNFDLNELKKTNDTLGHSVGDSLIAGFASLLKKTYEGVGVVGRMGGDEFIAIVDENEDFNAEEYIEKLKDNIDEANKKEEMFQYSVAIGYASSRDLLGEDGASKDGEVDARKVYTLADNRMYVEKRAFKGSD